MLTIESQLTVPGLTGAEVTDYLLNCTDETYQAWWPGVHRAFHPIATNESESR